MDPKSAELRIGVHRLIPGAGPLLRATSGSSGYDIASAEDGELTIPSGAVAVVRTGLALDLPPGIEGQVRSRSGLAARSGVFVLNSPGTIDSDYRGEVKIVLANLGADAFSVLPGDRIAQLVFMQVPSVCLVAVDEVAPTERGTRGFGSSGNTTIENIAPIESECRTHLDGETSSGSGASG